MASALFTTLTTGDSTAVQFTQAQTIDVNVYGTWDGGTLTLQVSHDGTNYVSAGSLAVLTADLGVRLVLDGPQYVRGSLSGEGASTDLDATYVGD